MAALVFKVGALAMKTLAKPLGDRFKNWVMKHPQYRQTVLTAAQVCMQFHEDQNGGKLCRLKQLRGTQQQQQHF